MFGRLGKLFLLLMGVLALSVPVWARVANVTIITEGVYPPWNKTMPDGSLGGFEIDMMRLICKESGWNCVYKAQSWENILPSVQYSMSNIGVASFTITHERAMMVSFSKLYADTQMRFLAHKGVFGVQSDKKSDKQGATPGAKKDYEHMDLEQLVSQLSGKRVGVQRGTVLEQYMDYLIREGHGIIVRRYNSPDLMVIDFQTRRLHVILADVMVLNNAIKQTLEGSDVEFVGPILNSTTSPIFGNGIGAIFNKKDVKLLSQFNVALKLVKKDGRLSQLSIKYFGFDPLRTGVHGVNSR